MDLIPTRTFLFKQVEKEGGQKQDIIARKGVMQKGVTEREAVKFWGSFELNDSQKKKLTSLAKANGWTRIM